MTGYFEYSGNEEKESRVIIPRRFCKNRFRGEHCLKRYTLAGGPTKECERNRDQDPEHLAGESQTTRSPAPGKVQD